MNKFQRKQREIYLETNNIFFITNKKKKKKKKKSKEKNVYCKENIPIL